MRKNLVVPWAAILLSVSFGVLTAKVSARFPPVYIDEVFASVDGHNLWTGQGLRYSLYDDIFDRSVYPMRDALPDITRVLYYAWDGLWLKGFSHGYRPARWSSVAAGMMVLGVMYLIGRALKSPALGVATLALCAVNPIMILSSSIVRPEIVLLLGEGFFLWLILRVPSGWVWKPFTIGVGVGLLSAVHWNAAASGVGLLVFYAMIDRRAHRLRRLVWMSAGMISGALAAFRMVDAGRFLLSLRSVNFLVSSPPPIVSDPWHPWRWMGALLHTFFTGQTSFFNFNLVPGWAVLIGASWIGLFLVLIASWMMSRQAPAKRSWKSALAAGGLATLVTLTCLIKRQEATYAVILFPFFLPLAADVWSERGLSSWVLRLRALSGVLLVGSALLYARYVVRVIPLRPSYDQISQALHAHVPDSSLRMAGPAVLWFAWDPKNFRDIGAIITSGWYTGGRRDFAGTLSPWKPEVLVIEPFLRHRLWGDKPALPELQKSFQARVQYLGVMRAGESEKQDWELYRLFWDSPS